MRNHLGRVIAFDVDVDEITLAGVLGNRTVQASPRALVWAACDVEIERCRIILVRRVEVPRADEIIRPEVEARQRHDVELVVAWTCRPLGTQDDRRELRIGLAEVHQWQIEHFEQVHACVELAFTLHEYFDSLLDVVAAVFHGLGNLGIG